MCSSSYAAGNTSYLVLITTDFHLFGLDTDEVRLHLLGTDRFGRDLWGRICLAGRVSLVAEHIGGGDRNHVIGSSVGVISGYYGGAIDNVIQRLVEVVMSFPELPLVDGAGGGDPDDLVGRAEVSW